MSRCRHPRVRAWQRWPNSNGGCWVDNGYWFNHGGAQSPEADRLTCLTCGHWLPLGPANDTPETAVEVRAAELVQCATGLLTWPLGEFRGWMAGEMAERAPDDAEGQAGWLARAIWTHKESDRG